MPARFSGVSRNSCDAGQRPGPRTGGQRRIQPATQLHLTDVMELGDDRGEIGFDLDPAGTAVGQVRVVEQLQAVGSAAPELEQHQGELAAGIGRAGVVPVDHRKPAVWGAADVVGPEVAVTDLDRRHGLHHRLDVDQIGTDRGQLIRERRVLAPGLRQRSPPTPPPRPARCTTRAGVRGWAAPSDAARPRCGRPAPGRAVGRAPPGPPR